MSENELLDRCLAALKKCQSEEEVKEALENYELTDEELERICGGCGGVDSVKIDGSIETSTISGGFGSDSISVGIIK